MSEDIWRVAAGDGPASFTSIITRRPVDSTASRSAKPLPRRTSRLRTVSRGDPASGSIWSACSTSGVPPQPGSWQAPAPTTCRRHRNPRSQPHPDTRPPGLCMSSNPAIHTLLTPTSASPTAAGARKPPSCDLGRDCLNRRSQPVSNDSCREPSARGRQALNHRSALMARSGGMPLVAHRTGRYGVLGSASAGPKALPGTGLRHGLRATSRSGRRAGFASCAVDAYRYDDPLIGVSRCAHPYSFACGGGRAGNSIK